MSSTFEIDVARTKFPSLVTKQVFFDNAGGSQVFGSVANSYISSANVQLGASYASSKKCSEIYSRSYEAGAQYINASTKEIVFGASSTQVLRNLASALVMKPGDEIIVSLVDHESNIDPWTDIAERLDLKIKWWDPVNIKNAMC